MENNLLRQNNNKITQIEGGDKDKKELLAQRLEINHEEFSGPLPHPGILAKYNEIVPGSADRIIKMAEDQSAHRRDLERKVIQSDIINSRLGLIFGLVIGLAAFVLSYKVAELELPWLAGIISVGYVVSLVGTFIYGSQGRRKDLKNKKEEN